MATPRVLVLRAPGTNCDQETAFAFEVAGGRTDVLHVNRLLERSGLIDEYQILCLPGGFSYGDDLGAGRIFSNQLRQHLADRLRDFHAAGNLILGICNGFQVLMRTGLLVQEDDAGPPASLTQNDSGKFEDRWVALSAEAEQCVFLRGVETLYLPIAHAEGKFVFRDETAAERLAERGQLALRYRPAQSLTSQSQPSAGYRVAATTGTSTSNAAATATLEATTDYPANPNGSHGDVAGICDASGRVLGLMPHPERHIDPTQHPCWTRIGRRESGDGLALFRNAIAYFA